VGPQHHLLLVKAHAPCDLVRAAHLPHQVAPAPLRHIHLAVHEPLDPHRHAGEAVPVLIPHPRIIRRHRERVRALILQLRAQHHPRPPLLQPHLIPSPLQRRVQPRPRLRPHERGRQHRPHKPRPAVNRQRAELAFAHEAISILL
jgi:hypothetical protein